MSELTPRTRRLVEALFPQQVQAGLLARLENECSRKALGCERWRPEQMERLWFAVPKICSSTPDGTDRAFELARADWRDLLVAADFGTDLDAHNVWWEQHATQQRLVDRRLPLRAARQNVNVNLEDYH